MAIGLTGLAIGGQVLKLGYGAYQSYNAKKRLDRLGARPELEITPEAQKSYDTALKEAEFGFSPQERAAFKNRMGRRYNTIFNRGRMAGGGGISSAINAGLLSGDIDAELNFASQDANLKRSKRMYADQRGDYISGLRNQRTREQLSYRNAIEQALGTALSQGRTSMVEAVADTPYNLALAKYTESMFKNPAEEVSEDMQTPRMEVPSTLQMRKPSIPPQKGYGGLVRPVNQNLLRYGGYNQRLT